MSSITATGLRDGQPHTITTEIDDTEIARRKTVADERRAARQEAGAPKIDPVVQRLTDILIAKGVITKADSDAALAAPVSKLIG